jgi:hypothetical protein
MSKRFWRRLAGCIATSVALTAASAPEYRAGAARSDHVRAAVVEDRRGHRAVFADADFPITRAISDFVAVQLLNSYEIDRAFIVLSGTGAAAPDTAAILAVIGQSLAALAPATLTAGAVISIRNGNDCFTIPLGRECGAGAVLRGPIRAAFQMVDLPHPLQTRDASPQTYPVQAVAIGKATLLVLGGSALALHSDVPVADEPRVRAAVANVLKRVR